VLSAKGQVTAAEVGHRQAKAGLEAARRRLNLLKPVFKQGLESALSLTDAEAKLSQAESAAVLSENQVTSAKAALAAAEAEVQSLLEPAPVQPVVLDMTGVRSLDWKKVEPFALTFDGRLIASTAAPAAPAAGSVADKLRAALDKPFALDVKGPLPLDEAFDAVLKGAGLGDLTVRLPHWATKPYPGFSPETVPTVPALKGELSLAGWLALVGDSARSRLEEVFLKTPAGKDQFTPHELYVRDYGLLYTPARLAPPGALTLAEFAKQKSAASAPPVSAALREKLRSALGKTVALDAMPNAKPAEVYQAILRGAGLDLEVEVQAYPEGGTISVGSAERSVSAWLELLIDRLNDSSRRPDQRAGIYVREYGLLVAFPSNTPPGAVPLSQIR
jgi:hypothetical protein